MNEIEELDVTIGPDGTVSVRVRGVAGDRCLSVTKALEDRLGTVVAREPTEELDRAQQLEAGATVGSGD